jgi:hypothetical protein
VAASHDTLAPTSAQPPAAVHSPVLVMQTMAVGVVGHCASAVPTATLPQVPTTLPPVERLQAWQGPLQALSQHTPSTQVKPVLQSVVRLQVSPCPRLSPHLWVSVLHGTPTQSASPAQLVAHWKALTPVSHLL